MAVFSKHSSLIFFMLLKRLTFICKFPGATNSVFEGYLKGHMKRNKKIAVL